MNIKITKEEHERLCKVPYEEYLFGSRLFGTATENSDYDYIRVYSYEDVFPIRSLTLPNIHSFQVDLEGVQYIWMTEEQFWGGLGSGDGTMQSDIIMFGDSFEEDFALDICRTYNVIKAYLGVAKRDLKLHRDDKKRFHAHRSIYIAQELKKGFLPKLEIIQKIPDNLADRNQLDVWCADLRKEVNEMYDNGELVRYYVEDTGDSLLDKMQSANNIKEFKYK